MCVVFGVNVIVGVLCYVLVELVIVVVCVGVSYVLFGVFFFLFIKFDVG